jgi:hypothetical protein
MVLTTKNRSGFMAASAVALGSLLGPAGCDRPDAPVPGGATQKSASLPQTPVSLEATLASIALKVRSDYEHQNTRGAFSAPQAEAKVLGYRAELARALPPGAGPAEGSDFSSSQVRREMLNAFLAQGYLVSSGVAGGGFVSVEIHKLSGPDTSRSFPTFKLGPHELTVSPDMRMFTVESTLVGTYEDLPGNKITGFRSLRPGCFLPEANAIILSPSDIAEYAEQSSADPKMAWQTVELNELAHAALQHYLREVPNFEQLQLTRDLGNGRRAPLEVRQVGEAFSDYVTLRYGEEISGFLSERARESFESYAYSDELLKRGLVSVLQANPPIVDVKAIDLGTFKSSLGGVAAYVKAHPESLPAVKNALVQAYEGPLSKIISVIKAEASKAPSGVSGSR